MRERRARRAVPEPSCTPASSRTEPAACARADDAEALRLDGRGGDRPLAQVARRRIRARRGACRGRDGQGDRGLRGGMPTGTLGSILVPEGASGRRRRARSRLSRTAPAALAALRDRRPSRGRRASLVRRRPRMLRPPADGSASGRPNATSRREAEGCRARRLLARHRGHRAGRPDHASRTSSKPASRRRDGARSDHRRARARYRRVELTPTQATIARRMVESATTIPVFTVVGRRRRVADRRAPARRAGRGRRRAVDQRLRRQGRRASAAASSRASTRRTSKARSRCYSRVNVGIAVATDDALLVPVVLDADRRSLDEIAAETRRLAEAARRRTLALEDLHDATFTVSNLGMFGVRSFTALVDPPQVAILAVGGSRGRRGRPRSGSAT